MAFREIDPHHKFWLSNEFYKVYAQKNSWRNNIIRRLLQGLWFHAQREDGANTIRFRPIKRNRRSHNEAI